MNEEIELITDETRERMEKALEHLEHELARLRAGRSILLFSMVLQLTIMELIHH